MAYRVNGTGTTYVTCKNEQKHLGFCDQCGRRGILRSYDTHYALSVLWIPVLPLGKKRISQHCAHCDRFYVTPLAQWNADRLALEDKLGQTLSGPLNRDVIRECLASMAGLHCPDLLEANIDAILQAIEGDAELTAFTSDVLMTMGDFERGYQVAVKAFALDQSDENRERMAVSALNTNRLDEARAGLNFALTGKMEERYPLLLAMVEGYQAQGRHDDALATLDAMDAAFPKKAGNKDTKRLRKLSTKHQGTQRPVKPKAAGNPSGNQVNPKLLAGVIVLLIGAFVAGSFYYQQRGDVYFINGLPVDYTVEVNGEAYVLPAAEVVALPLGNGTFEVTVPDENLGIKPVSFKVDTGFFDQLLSPGVTAINPDSFALLLKEAIPYAEDVTPKVDEMYEYEFMTGKQRYTYTDVRYAFEEAPDQISVDGSEVVMRRRLSNSSTADYVDAADYVFELKGERLLTEYLDTCIRAGAAGDDIHYVATYYMSEQGATAFLEKHIDAYMDDVDYHRSYQDAAKFVNLANDIAARYKQYAEAHPDNPNFLYLAGRVNYDPDEAERLYEASYNGTAKSEWGMWAHTYHHLSNGDWEAAQALARRGQALFPEHPLFPTVETTVALAEGRWSPIIEHFNAVREEAGTVDNTSTGFRNMIIALEGSGDSAASDEFIGWIGKPSSAEDADYYQSLMEDYTVFRDYLRSGGENLDRLSPDGSRVIYREECDLLNGDCQKVMDDPENATYNTM